MNHLVRYSHGYIVYGNWMCEKKDKEDEDKCEYEYQREFEHGELETLLKFDQKLYQRMLYYRLSEECDKCEKSIVVTSFRLYTATILDVSQLIVHF